MTVLFQDELLSKKKKEKKKKLSSRPADDLRCISQDRPDRYSCDNTCGLPVSCFVCLFVIVGLLFQSSGPSSLAGYPPSEAQHLALPVHQKPATDCPGTPLRHPPLISPGPGLSPGSGLNLDLCLSGGEAVL